MPTVDLEDHGFEELADGSVRPDCDGYRKHSRRSAGRHSTICVVRRL